MQILDLKDKLGARTYPKEGDGMQVPDITYKADLGEVDWVEMKATLEQDAFDNGRTSEQLRSSFENSFATCIAYVDGKIIGTARVLSDGVCNAYIVDVWTLSAHRRQGIARAMIDSLLAKLPGQHVYLFTDDVPEFYTKLGFEARGIGMEMVVGDWLKNE